MPFFSKINSRNLNKLFPFCTEDSNNSIKWDFFTIDTTKINQMIDNGTLWQYSNRII